MAWKTLLTCIFFEPSWLDMYGDMYFSQTGLTCIGDGRPCSKPQVCFHVDAEIRHSSYDLIFGVFFFSCYSCPKSFAWKCHSFRQWWFPVSHHGLKTSMMHPLSLQRRKIRMMKPHHFCRSQPHLAWYKNKLQLYFGNSCPLPVVNTTTFQSQKEKDFNLGIALVLIEAHVLVQFHSVAVALQSEVIDPKARACSLMAGACSCLVHN